MPKPPILTAPLPNDPIASQAWGTPVTVAVNGIATGKTLMGCVIATTAGGTLSTALQAVPIEPSWVFYDSDGYVDAAGDLIRIPAGLGGLYRVDMSFAVTGNAPGTGLRMQVYKNGTAVYNATHDIWHTSGDGHSFGAVMLLNDSDTVQMRIQIEAATMAVPNRYWSVLRLADWVPAALSKPGPEAPITPDQSLPVAPPDVIAPRQTKRPK